MSDNSNIWLSRIKIISYNDVRLYIILSFNKIPFDILNGPCMLKLASDMDIKGIVSKISILRQNGQSGTKTEEIT